MTQTCDTDFNQHVRRGYIAHESGRILEMMRQGVAAPSIDLTGCIDMMMEVLCDPQLHCHAADGYTKVGALCGLDDAIEDHLIVREAGEFFRSLGMRQNINREVAIVRQEARAGRLKWTFEDVQSLIVPFPPSKVDAILENIGDHHQLDEDEQPYDDAAVADDDSAVA